METDLDVKIRATDGISVVDIRGDLDEFTCRDLRDALQSLLTDGEHKILINLVGVNYMDSAGLGTLLGGLRRVREAYGELAFSGPNPRVQRILTVTGIDRVLYMHDEENAAIESLRLASLPSSESSREV